MDVLASHVEMSGKEAECHGHLSGKHMSIGFEWEDCDFHFDVEVRTRE
jgi:hypothetical protein